MKVKVMRFLDIIMGSFRYIAMYICGGLIASQDTENFRQWGIASIIICAFFLVMLLVYIGLFLSMGPEEVLEVDRSDLNSITTSISVDDKVVDYRIIGDTFSVKIECPPELYNDIKPLLEEFAEEMLDAECADSDEEA